MSDMNRRDFGRSGLVGLAALALPNAAASAAAQAPDSRGYRYIHLDVFTDRRLQGNQLFVFVQPAGLDTDMMQTMTRESNLSECTFVFPPEQAGTDHRVRIFTRTAETPFAGHPTIGTAFALAHTGVLKPGLSHTTFGLGVGPTNIDLEWKDGRLAFAWMTQLKPTFGKTVADSRALAAALGVEALDPRAPGAGGQLRLELLHRPAADAQGRGRRRDRSREGRCRVRRRRHPAARHLRSSAPSAEPTTPRRTAGCSRSGGIEDPATGSAVGPAGCFAAKYGFVPPERIGAMIFQQGVLARRPSRLHVKVAMTGAEVTGVKVGGASVVVGEGSMGV